MPEEELCPCADPAARVVRKLTLPDGFQVGILNLESILKEVAGLKLDSDDLIEEELLKRVKIYNYVAPVAEGEYSEALFKEFKRKYGKA